MKFSIILIFMLFIIGYEGRSDSPLTSTPFYKAYSDVEIVQYAQKKGEPDKKIADYLSSAEHNSDIKAAIVNAFGWSLESKNNADKYLKILKIRFPGMDESPQSMKSFLTNDEIFCFAYMMAMDNYQDPKNALLYIDYTLNTENTNFTYAIVGGLIKSQMLLKSNWCGIWSNFDNVIKNERLDFRMKLKAIFIISDYIVLYKNDCEEMSD